MSKAFTKEDVDPPERSGRVRSASGLPPGAINYITAAGAQRLREEASKLRRERPKDERLEELTRILSSVTVVEPLTEASKVIAFGAVVTVEAAHGSTETFRIVGVDEVTLWPNAVSWISPTGKTLLAAELGDRATIDGNDAAPVRIVKVEYDALES